MIDDEIIQLIENAYHNAETIIQHSKELIFESAQLLKDKKNVKAEELIELMKTKYFEVFEMKHTYE
jgi:ATP-dependent Zn protease